ncbi:MAG TPA: hypothetical protein VJ840_00705 [Gemmatimonadaceae bacterium]|nr:hypothetical protein [Gemmatimonadaceae bacterium]
MKNPSIWFRLLAGVLAFFTFGHTVGTRHAITDRPQEALVIAAMKGFRVPVMGFERTYWEFYRGFSVSISILLATLMVFAWQVASLSRRDPGAAFPFAVTLLVACIAQAVISFAYFFTAPIITSILTVVCAAIGTALLARERGRLSNARS